MKKRILTPVVLAGFLAMLAVVAAHAGTAGSVTTKIPFDFTSGTTSMPAGSYSVQETSTEGILALRSRDGRVSIYVSSFGVDAKKLVKPHLVFHQYGNRYFLARIQFGADSARQLLIYREELEIARGAAVNAVAGIALKPVLVYIDAQ